MFVLIKILFGFMWFGFLSYFVFNWVALEIEVWVFFLFLFYFLVFYTGEFIFSMEIEAGKEISLYNHLGLEIRFLIGRKRGVKWIDLRKYLRVM